MATNAADSRTRPSVVRAAERLVDRIATLAEEVEQLRAENVALQREMREAIALFERAADGGQGGGVRRSRSPNGRSRRRAAGGNGARGRATPAEVTQEVVRAVLAKLGEATASEIAAEITSAGAPVNGRAIRFLAEAAGATTFRGDDGQRRYRL